MCIGGEAKEESNCFEEGRTWMRIQLLFPVCAETDQQDVGLVTNRQGTAADIK